MADTASLFKIIDNLETILSDAALEGDIQFEDGHKYFIVDVNTSKGSTPIFFKKSILALSNFVESSNEFKVASPTLFSCDICKFRTRRKLKIQNHMLVKHQTKYFFCQKCGLKFRSKQERENHTSLFCLSENSCKLCEFKASSNRQLKKHVDIKHKGLRHYCSHCDYSTTRKETLKIHEDAVHRKIKHNCQFCDYISSYKRQVKIHEAVAHKNVEFKCSQCDFKAKRQLYVNQHELRFHGTEDHHCDLCHFKSRWKQGLKKHIREKHTDKGRRKSFCNICGIYLSCQNDVSRHVKEVHERSVSYQCSFCGRSFHKKANMKVHERIHTGEKPYTCNKCGQAFGGASNLYHHKKKHHPENYVEVSADSRQNQSSRSAVKIEENNSHKSESDGRYSDCKFSVKVEEVSSVTIDESELDQDQIKQNYLSRKDLELLDDKEPELGSFNEMSQINDYNKNNISYLYTAQTTEFQHQNHFAHHNSFSGEQYRRILMANIEKPEIWSPQNYLSSQD